MKGASHGHQQPTLVQPLVSVALHSSATSPTQSRADKVRDREDEEKLTHDSVSDKRRTRIFNSHIEKCVQQQLNALFIKEKVKVICSVAD